MRSLKVTLIAGAAFAAAFTSAQAADLGPIMQPRQMAPVQVEEMTGGWYLRGDIGVGAQKFKEFDFHQTNAATGGAWPADWRIDQRDIKDTFFIGGGVGYQWNSWLRADVTGEYRADVKFKAIGSYTNFPNPLLGRAFDVYDGDHSAIVVMANGYIDLGTWFCLTPFVGAGVGAAYHRTAAVSDLGINNNGLGSSALGFANTDHSNWAFAWALHAGVAYSVSNNFKMEFAYRYLNMGSADTAEVLCGASGCGAVGGGPRAFYTLRDMDSHDFKLGMRWMLTPDVAPAPQPYPLMRKG
jgi:opacity protein-like surface antigen